MLCGPDWQFAGKNCQSQQHVARQSMRIADAVRRGSRPAAGRQDGEEERCSRAMQLCTWSWSWPFGDDCRVADRVGWHDCLDKLHSPCRSDVWISFHLSIVPFGAAGSQFHPRSYNTAGYERSVEGLVNPVSLQAGVSSNPERRREAGQLNPGAERSPKVGHPSGAYPSSLSFQRYTRATVRTKVTDMSKRGIRER